MAESNPPPPPTPRDGSTLFQPAGEKPSSASVEATPAHQIKTTAAPPSVPPNPYKKRKQSTPAAPSDTPSAYAAPASNTSKSSSEKTPSTSSAIQLKKTPKSNPTPASSTANRNACLITGFHKWSRDPLYSVSIDIATSGELLRDYEDNFSTQIRHRFKQENQTSAKFEETREDS